MKKNIQKHGWNPSRHRRKSGGNGINSGLLFQHHTNPKSNAHCFVSSFLEPGMVREANFRPSKRKKTRPTEFWTDIELLDPDFASFVCKYVLMYLKATEMCWRTLVNVSCLKMSTFNARTGLCRNHERRCSKANFLTYE